MMEYVILWIVCGIGAAAIASSKGRSVFGWLIGGFLLGPIGLLIVGLMENRHPTRVHCENVLTAPSLS